MQAEVESEVGRQPGLRLQYHDVRAEELLLLNLPHDVRLHVRSPQMQILQRRVRLLPR